MVSIQGLYLFIYLLILRGFDTGSLFTYIFSYLFCVVSIQGLYLLIYFLTFLRGFGTGSTREI